MGLFAIDPEYVGVGLPLWLPKGTVLVEELEKLAKEMEFAAGYQRVKTPHLAKEKLYLTSGHLPYYAESMFPPMEVKEEGSDIVERYYLKAMNCPHHHRIFAAEPRSYSDLPLRLAEYGCCYRYEASGSLMGLMRVRSMNMNDAHIYCTPEQFALEFVMVNQMYLRYFQLFGLDKYVMRFSTHSPEGLGKKYVNEPEQWLAIENTVRAVLKSNGINFVEVPNEAAFYGPKIDIQVISSCGREFTLSTNQVDFVIPKRFGLVYHDQDNTKKTPLCIHRAPLSTHERFIGFLIEHYNGNFPLWLAPDQVRVLTIGDNKDVLNYAKGIVAELRKSQVRADGDYGSDPIRGKIQSAEKARVHSMFVIGARDYANGEVSLRVHGKGQVGVLKRPEAIRGVLQAIADREP